MSGEDDRNASREHKPHTAIPLDEVFQALAEDASDRRLRRASARMAEELRRGAALDKALSSVQDGMPAYMHRSLQTAADAGQTATVLEGVARHEASRRRLSRQIAAALMYPAVVMALLGAVVVVLSIYVVPQFASAYEDFEMETSITTDLMFRLSTALPTAFRLGGCVLGVCLFMAFFSAGRRALHWLRTGLPVVGPMYVLRAQHEFASVMAALTSQRVTLTDAMQCTVASLRDKNLTRAASIAADKCARGASLSRSLSESIHFDPTLPSLAAWGEQQDALATAMSQAADNFEDRLDLYANLIRRCLPPLVMAAVVGIVLFYIAALLVPMVTLLQSFMWF